MPLFCTEFALLMACEQWLCALEARNKGCLPVASRVQTPNVLCVEVLQSLNHRSETVQPNTLWCHEKSVVSFIGQFVVLELAPLTFSM
jgi:hypothetical protein